MKGSLGFRKGAWTAQEDNLLRQCIAKYGEGRWHKVPFRAGLNRCRKSARLRWLNYLKPNIKRGNFKWDEVDLMIRLHKLLGNRWSVIAGRLPGRTANGVKNYWNTHLKKKHIEQKQNPKFKKTTIIKPQPRNFSKNKTLFKGDNSIICNNNMHYGQPSRPNKGHDNGIKWVESILFEEESEKRVENTLSETNLEKNFTFTALWDEEIQPSPTFWYDLPFDDLFGEF